MQKHIGSTHRLTTGRCTRRHFGCREIAAIDDGSVIGIGKGRGDGNFPS